MMSTNEDVAELKVQTENKTSNNNMKTGTPCYHY